MFVYLVYIFEVCFNYHINMSRNSPKPECLADTMVHKRARIQSQRPLSPKSALNPPFFLKEPLENVKIKHGSK